MFRRKSKADQDVATYTAEAQQWAEDARKLRLCSDAANRNGDNDHAAALGKRAIECDTRQKQAERIAFEASYGIVQPDYNW